MPDPFPSPPGTNPPRHVKSESGGMAWMFLTLGVAIIVALGIFVFIPRGQNVATTTPPPAVTRGPAPIDETTGIAIQPLPGQQQNTVPRIPDAPPPQ